MTPENKTKVKIEWRSVESPYRLIELIGSGGMANVYRAVQVSLDREVAIKRLHPYLMQNQPFLARFQKEAKAAASLRHENLVSVIDYGLDDDGYFIVMEYVRGKSLRELLDASSLPLEAALVIASKVALGLDFCHRAGVVHRDVKPGNILLSEEGAVKLADFGIAKGEDSSITVTGTTLGSPAYMAPEQLRSMEVDGRADIFSLGVVLYEMLSSRKPFDGDNYSAVITSILTSRAKPLCEISALIPVRLSLLVAQMLEKDPDQRIARMDEVLEKLDEQLRYYGIQQKRELLKKFLASPSQFLHEAEARRVKRHLDSGIYYFHLGQGKIAEAKREFLEALRWDRENQAARQYLARLSAEPTGPVGAGMALQEALNKRLLPYGLVLIFVIGIFLYFGFGILETATHQLTFDRMFKKQKARQELKKPESPPNSARSAPKSLADRGFPTVKTKSALPAFTLNQEKSEEFPPASRAPVPATWIQIGDIPHGEEAYLVVSAKRAAYIRVDGFAQGKVPPPRAFKLAAGKHEIEYHYPGFKTKSKSVRLDAGDSKLVNEDLRRERKSNGN